LRTNASRSAAITSRKGRRPPGIRSAHAGKAQGALDRRPNGSRGERTCHRKGASSRRSESRREDARWEHERAGSRAFSGGPGTDEIPSARNRRPTFKERCPASDRDPRQCRE
jgi:hypothetical protein